MSRIHDALKKAAREKQRTARDEAGKAVHPQGTATEGMLSSGPGDLSDTAVRQHLLGLELPETNMKWCEALETSAWVSDPSKLLVLGQPSPDPSVEAFRTLRTRLYLLRKQRSLQKILISSPLSQDGKTFVTANLAQALAQQRGRVLLVDGDLRFSKLHLTFGAPPTPGLTECLKGNCSEEMIVQKGSVQNIFLVPGGTHTEEATELLTNGRLEGLLRKWSASFDWILFDSPPVVPVSDAKIIGELCDGVLMVVRSGSTTLTWAQKACREFGNNQLLGIVLNRVSPRSAYSSSRYYVEGKRAES